jgi:anti-sigma regulatory factor (Ser/Thr protein kinase)
MADWLQAADIDEELIADVVLAVDEACANSIEHAYRDTEPGPLCVEADMRSGKLQVRIVDRGSWKVPSTAPTFRGRGLSLIKAVSAEVDFHGTELGTTVEMIFELPAALARQPG